MAREGKFSRGLKMNLRKNIRIWPLDPSGDQFCDSGLVINLEKSRDLELWCLIIPRDLSKITCSVVVATSSRDGDE